MKIDFDKTPQDTPAIFMDIMFLHQTIHGKFLGAGRYLGDGVIMNYRGGHDVDIEWEGIIAWRDFYMRDRETERSLNHE